MNNYFPDLFNTGKNNNLDSIKYLRSIYLNWLNYKSPPAIEMVETVLQDTTDQPSNKLSKSILTSIPEKTTFLFDNFATSPQEENQLIKNFLVKGSYLGDLAYRAWLEAENSSNDGSKNNISYSPILRQPIKIGVYCNFKPVCFLNSQNQPDGFEVRLLEKIFEPLLSCFSYPESKNIPTHKIYQFVPIANYHDIWTLPEQIDIAAGGIADSFARQRYGVHWTIPHFTVKRSMVYLKSDTYLTDLKDEIYREMKRQDTSSESTLMTKLSPNSRVIATYGSTGWADATTRLRDRSDIILIKGTTDEEDMKMLLAGKVTGVMRGDHVCRALVSKNPEILDYMYPWDIVSGITPERIFQGQWLPTETFCFPTNNLQLKQFMDLRITELTSNYYLQELAKVFLLSNS